MSFQLYDISVKTSIQMLGSVLSIMQKAKEHLGEEKVNALLSYRLADDMLPMTFQLNSIRHHSLGSLEGIKAGVFSPPPALPEMNFDDFIAYIQEALDRLNAESEEDVNALGGKPMYFRMGKKFELPFISENFSISFSIPNLMFHLTTLYDMFRINGVPLGKIDYLGAPRVGH